MTCRHCGSNNKVDFLDLGSSPPSNAYLSAEALDRPEVWFPLRVFACGDCWLVQTEDYAHFDDLFAANYAYFSSFSQTWLDHSRQYVAQVTERYGLGAASHVVEVAANDGYLLQYVRERGIPCLGVEPTASTAAAARAKGVEIVEAFFGVDLADHLVAEGRAADLIVANNVLAHVPDINDFTAGFARLLKPAGVATFEFPHLVNLVSLNQFDTVYHEHFSYLSLTSLQSVFERTGLIVFDAEKLATHGGSLRLHVGRADGVPREVTDAVRALAAEEAALGVATPAYYRGVQQRAETAKNDFTRFLIEAWRDGKTVAGYGAAAKGNTLLNFAGVRPDLLAFVCDAAPSKQGRFLPGSRIPILPPSALDERRPDFVVILPWNLRQEIVSSYSHVMDWGGRFVVAVPGLEIL